MINQGEEYIHECIVTNAEEALGDSGGEKGADDHDAEKKLNAFIVKQTLEELGYNEDFIIGCIACWLVESDMRCARLESDFVLKSEAEAAFMTFGSGIDISPYYGSVADGATSYNAYTSYGDGPYASLGNSGGTTINGGYFYDGHTCPGFGLVQWTASRGANIMKSVDATQAAGYNYSVIDMPYQLAFALSEWQDNDKLSWEGGAWEGISGEEAMTEFCFRYIEFGGGQPPADLTAKRTDQIENAKNLLNSATDNAEYIADITPMASILAESEVSGNKRSIFEATLCMSTAHNELDSIPEMAYSLSYVIPLDYTSTNHAYEVSMGRDYANRLLAPRVITDEEREANGKKQYRACSEYYVLAHYLVANNIAKNLSFDLASMEEDPWFSSCDRSTATIIRAAGADDRFALGHAEGQVDYVYNHDGGSIDKSADHRYCGGEDSNKLWDAVGFIDSGYYYPYGTGVSLSPGSILISGGTSGSTGNPTGDDYYGLPKRVGNNFLNVANDTGGHIITYSGSAALQAHYGDTLVEEWWKYYGTSNHPNNSTQSQYDTLIMDDMKFGVSGDMQKGNSNKTSIADESNKKYDTYYTVLEECKDKPINSKTGLMTFKSRGELYCELVKSLKNNGQYAWIAGSGFKYTGSTPNGIEGDANRDTCLTGMAHPYSWPIWKMDVYVDLCYRYQQMVRFSTAAEFVSIPSEQDTNAFRSGNETYYVYSYGFRNGDYADILSYDEEISKVLYDNGSGVVWYYGKAFEYRYMISNDMLQDLIQTFTVREQSEYAEAYPIVNGIDGNLARIINGKLLLGPGLDGLNGNYGLTDNDWKAIIQYCNEGVARLNMEEHKRFIETWFHEVIGIPTGFSKFTFDPSEPYKTTWVDPEHLSNAEKVGAHLYLHYQNIPSGANGKYVWAVYHRDNGGAGFGSVQDLASYYIRYAASTNLDKIIVTGYTNNKQNNNMPSHFYNKTLYPHRILEQCDDRLNHGASVLDVDLDGGAISCKVTRACSCSHGGKSCPCSAPKVISFSGIDEFAQTLASKHIKFNVTIVVTCPNAGVTYAYTENNCTTVSTTFADAVKNAAHAKVQPGCCRGGDGHDDIIKIYVQMAEYEGADSLVESETIGIENSALANNLASMAVAKDPIYVLVPYGSYTLNYTYYTDTILIDSSFNVYNDTSPTYDNIMSESFYHNTIDEVSTVTHVQVTDVVYEDVFGVCVDDENAIAHVSDTTVLQNHTIGGDGAGSPNVNEYEEVFISQLCGVNTEKYSSDGFGPPQHLIYTGLGGNIGTYIQQPGADKPSLVHANIDPSTFYDESLDDPNSENYVEDAEDKRMNTALKGMYGYGSWYTDGSIGSHGPESKYDDFSKYFSDKTYRVFVNQSATDKKNIDGDYKLSEDGLRFEFIVDGQENFNDSEAFIYGVIEDEGYRYYENELTWDEQKVAGQGENSFYARLMHIWNGYEELILSNTIHDEVQSSE